MANETRDRLAELYAKAKRNMWGRTFHSDLERNMYIADYLIANDVVPVVRCKDCVFWDTESIGFSDEHICKMHSIVAVHSRYTNPTDYCSYGERRCENG